MGFRDWNRDGNVNENHFHALISGISRDMNGDCRNSKSCQLNLILEFIDQAICY